ncbi:pickpocket protein 28 [Folsomia candida]|uniref:pickpocket protein 28 n=1 Tax=Folsomia candida TaxID=158441 RepID=UPI000B8FA14E|nr:pickpocket protein 28 [Folsomia candida]
MGHPLVVTFETEEINIGDARFPQIGICPNGGFKASAMESAIDYYFKVKKGVEIESPDGLRWNKNDVDGVLKVIDQACSYSTTYADKNGVEDEDNGNTWFNYWVDKNGTGGLLDNVTDPAIKNTTIQSELGGHTKEEISNWMKVDFDESIANIKKKKSGKGKPAIPWRQAAPGKSSGLKFVIKEELKDKACVHTDGTGFTLAINHPRDESQIQKFGTSLPYGKDIYISLYPEVLLAETDAKEIDIGRRGCYFSDDEGPARLTFYKKYSRQNCLEECFAKAVYEQCKCGRVTAPGLPGRILCSPNQMDCVRDKENAMYNEGLNEVCPLCRPNCQDTKYRTSVT